MPTVSPGKRLKQRKKGESKQRKSWRSRDFESYRSVQLIVKVKLTLSEPSEHSKMESAEPVERRKKRLNWLEGRPLSLIRPVVSNLLRRRS